MLLIHGNGPDADTWGPCFERLGERYRVIAYDRRSFSRSTHAPVKDFHVHSEDAAALLQQLSAVPAVVVGWSAGSVVALDLAVHYPERVKSLILVEASFNVIKHPSLAMVAPLCKLQVERRFSHRRGVTTYFRWVFHKKDGTNTFDRMTEAEKAALYRNTEAILAEIDAGTGEYLPHPQIRAIRCPMTVINGELSDVAFHKATARLQRMLPHLKTKTIAGSGHAIHLDRPDEFVQAVLEAAQVPSTATS